MSRLRWALLSCVVLIAASAAADTVNFLPPSPTAPTDPYYFGNSATFGPFTVTAYAFNNGWNLSELTGRDDTGAPVSNIDHGVGVCGEGKSNCTGHEDVNELSSISGMELLQISLTAGGPVTWRGILLSSLDKNGQLNQYVTGQVFFGDTGPGNVLDPTNFSTKICDFTIATALPVSGCVNPPTVIVNYDATVMFTDPVVSNYIYVWAPAVTVMDGRENDFLLSGVIGDVPPPPVPEPGSLSLFATGLAAASFAIRRKLRG